MGMLISVSVCSEDLAEAIRNNPQARQQAKNGKHYVSLTVSVNDQPDQFGKDAQVWLEQTKEQRERKEKRFFCGGGKVVFGKNQQPTGYQQNTQYQPTGYQQQMPVDDEMPF
jgi:hypothetical protein